MSEESKNELQKGARLLERLGWLLLLISALDTVLVLGWLDPGMQVFITSIAATLLVLGIIIRLRARSASRSQ